MRQFISVLILISMQYTVNTGDTLQLIFEQYCPMQVAEFREGFGS